MALMQRQYLSFNSLQVVYIQSCFDETPARLYVSIPYRQSIYYDRVVTVSVVDEFQFLIGSLYTLKGEIEKLQNDLFQFLIGSLYTINIVKKFKNELNVSIPYRQSIYSLRQQIGTTSRQVSIPYRQSIYPWTPIDMLFRRCCFNSLQVVYIHKSRCHA